VARKRITRSLPELPKRLTLGPKEHKTERLLEILRHLAVAAQEDQPRVFYSMRDVSNRFKVPVSAVARAYHRLERDGILSRIRGSQTTLRGLKFDRKLSVRAFIGLPALMSRFLTSQDYRMFFMRIRRQLRLSGFAAAMLFLDVTDPEEFLDRARKYEIDTMIWLQPGKSAKDAYLPLNDLGIRTIGVSDGSLPSLPCRYEIHRDKAVRTILRNWRSEAALKSALVVSTGERSSAADEQRLQELLEEEQLDHDFSSANSESILEFLEPLGRKENTGIIFLSSAASMSAFRAPEIFTKIFQRCRVALIAGPVNMPFAKVPNVQADLVITDWQAIADRITDDLINQRAFDQAAGAIVFEAEARLQVPLSSYAETI
jgi:hypothetical protein